MGLALTYEGINGFNNRVGRVSFLTRVRAFFSFDWLGERLARIAAKDITKIHDALFEALDLVSKEEMDLSGVTVQEFAKFQEVVGSLTKLKRIFKRGDFFDSQEFEHLMEDTLQLAYSLEAELRVHVYKSQKRKHTDDSLKEALAEKSKESLSGKL